MTGSKEGADAAQRIRVALARVAALREHRAGDQTLEPAVLQIKRLQARRFAGSYADLLAGPPYRDAARFFLEELYGDKDYAERDAQFARIAGAIQRLFPEQAAATAAALAELHALTEELDDAMGRAWAALEKDAPPEARRYMQAWRSVARRPDRVAQLNVVLGIGKDLVRLTRLPGLRLLLKMMRGPAAAAGMASLQHFLETGFDTFAAMAKQRNGAEGFLSLVKARESAWIDRLFDEDLVACETGLQSILGQAR